MKICNILTPGFRSPNGQAFLFPLIKWRNQLKDSGIKLNFYNQFKDYISDCDFIIIDNKFFSPFWKNESEKIEEKIFKLSQKNKNIFWFDITDSTGWDHTKPLRYVKALVKNQVLKNKNLYLRPIYANGRVYADYYFSKCKIEDSSPSWSIPILNKLDLNKIKVGWNSGIANYSLYGPISTYIIGKYLSKYLLNFSKKYTSAFCERRNDISCRYGIEYERESVAYQRVKINKILKLESTQKIKRASYFNELKNSKLVISPFGLGEITLKDFEVFLTGGLLVKPNMDHLETWPNFFISNKTYLPFKWDLSDLEKIINEILLNGKKRNDIANSAQELYKSYTSGSDAAKLFVEHFKSIIN